MQCLQIWTKYHLRQDPLGPQTEFDLDIYVTLNVKVKLLNLPKIAITLSIVDRFARYFNKRILMTHSIFYFSKCDLEFYTTLTVKVKLLISARIVITLLVIDKFDSHLDKIVLMTKPAPWSKYGFDLYMTLTVKVITSNKKPSVVPACDGSCLYKIRRYRFNVNVDKCTIFYSSECNHTFIFSLRL